MIKPETLVKIINDKKLIRSGAIRFWGDWFGRPYDNIHKIDRGEYNNKSSLLIIHFNHGEVLSVINPGDIVADSNDFIIKDASVVKWQWYMYGKEKIKDNLRFIEYRKNGTNIYGSTDIDWYQHKFETSCNEPAVKLY